MDSTMALDSTRSSQRRKPTRRETHEETTVDPHYSKLTRKSGATARTADEQARRERAAQVMSSTPHAATGFETLSSDTRRNVYGRRDPRKRKGNAAGAIIGLLVVAAFIGGGVFFWMHRSVNLTVDGKLQKIQIGSTLDEVFSQAKPDTTPGNYVSVTGEVIIEGKGYPYTATLDGKSLSRKKIESFRVKGGETLEFGDGNDRTEEYDVDYREVQPKLVFEGSWGSVSFVKQWGKVGKQEIRHGKESGQTADGDWVEELKDCVIRTKNIEPEGGQKLVALTFDDGPADNYTQSYLDILASKGAKGTFFNLAENVEYYPRIAERVVDAGHQICSHTNRHLDLTTLGQDEFLDEVSSARTIIKDATGVDTTIIRPPYGSFNRQNWLMSQGTVCASVIWNQDSLDWSLPGVDTIVQNSLADMTTGSIILMHDGGGDRSQDVEALPTLIDELQSRGYRLVTLRELLASDPEVPTEIAEGNATMPEGCVWPTEIGEDVTEDAS